jgi:hypothetical protein
MEDAMATKYHEIIVKGDDEVLKGFLDGFKTAKKIKTGVVLASDHPINTHHLKEILTLHGNYIHVIVSGRHHQTLIAAIKDTPDIECDIVSDVGISNAYLEFKFETFNRDVARDLKKMLGRLPAGLQLIDYDPKETVDPSAKGIEFYSPIHDYTFEGKGKIRGDVEKLIKFHERLDEHVFIEVNDIELEH